MTFKTNGRVVINSNGDGFFSNAYIRSSAGATATVGYTFQGSVSGFVSGGEAPPTVSFNTIDKFPFATNFTAASDVGDLTVTTRNGAGASSSENSFVVGGQGNPNFNFRNTIAKFPFASASLSLSNHGALTNARWDMGGHSSSSSGYVSGGTIETVTSGPTVNTNSINRFPFSSAGIIVDVGDLADIKISIRSHSSSTHGYVAGGSAGISTFNTIERFPFSTDTNSTNIGTFNTSSNYFGGASISSVINGYFIDGNNVITKFPFASETLGVSSGFSTNPSLISRNVGLSSFSEGFMAGGSIPPTPGLNVIEKFPFATDANATDVGDLTQSRRSSIGTQF